MAKGNKTTPTAEGNDTGGAGKKGTKDFGKIFDGIELDDITAIKRGIDEMRAYSNSAMNECIILANAFQQYHYMTRDGKKRDGEQDKRIREGAKKRAEETLRNLNMYVKRIEEELRGIQKTI